MIIVGGGPVGSLLAINLANRGYMVEVFEKRPDPRITKETEGRSINLALSKRGFDALENVGLKQEVMSNAISMKGRVMHSKEGELSFQPYGKDPSEVLYAVSRNELNKILLNAAYLRYGVKFHFNERCIDYDNKSNIVKFQSTEFNTKQILQSEILFACDGVNSVVRRSFIDEMKNNKSLEFINYGYKELTIPADKTGKWQIEMNALHIWPRRGYMLIALPDLTGTFTCTLFYPMNGVESFENLTDFESVKQFFDTEFSDAVKLIPNLPEMFLRNPLGTLATVRNGNWYHEDKMLLVGDAAHGIVPFLGQGLNCAFESIDLLMSFLDNSNFDWGKSFRQFTEARKEDSTAIADMALENFIEMRDRVADQKFLLKKQFELAIEKRFAPKFQSRYGLIQFSHERYSLIQKRGIINEDLLSKLMQRFKSVEEIDWKETASLVEDTIPTLREIGWKFA